MERQEGCHYVVYHLSTGDDKRQIKKRKRKDGKMISACKSISVVNYNKKYGCCRQL